MKKNKLFFTFCFSLFLNLHAVQDSALSGVIPVENVEHHQSAAHLTNAQQYVIVQNIADIEHVESGISAQEMVIEKCKDVLRVVGRRVLNAWYWMIKKIGF